MKLKFWRVMDRSQLASSSTDDDSKKSVIYPKNLLIKKDQLKIVKKALVHNTLLHVRDDSEKTFLASLMLYNYFRWDSDDKVIFLASTKALLAQQMEACQRIMKIPKSGMSVLASRVKPEKRVTAWQECQIIFTTPTLFLKDLEKSIVPTDLVQCVVIDEAHKAVGNQPYVKSIKRLHEANADFRLLALTSSSEAKPDQFPGIMKNLHITHVKSRDDSKARTLESSEQKRKREVDENDQGTQNKKMKTQQDEDSDSDFQPMKILKVEYDRLRRKIRFDDERKKSSQKIQKKVEDSPEFPAPLGEKREKKTP